MQKRACAPNNVTSPLDKRFAEGGGTEVGQKIQPTLHPREGQLIQYSWSYSEGRVGGRQVDSCWRMVTVSEDLSAFGMTAV